MDGSIISLDSIWKQMLFLCCGPYDVGYHVKRMLKRNSVRIGKLIRNAEVESVSLKGETISEYKIFSILAEWCRFSITNSEPLLTTLKDINATKPILEPKEIEEKISASFASQVDAAKKFRCTQCTYQTDHSGNFNSHIRIHTGEREFSCNICGASFVHKRSIAVHMDRHRRGTCSYIILRSVSPAGGMIFRASQSRLAHMFRKHERDQILNEREDLKRAAEKPKTADASLNGIKRRKVSATTKVAGDN